MKNSLEKRILIIPNLFGPQIPGAVSSPISPVLRCEKNVREDYDFNLRFSPDLFRKFIENLVESGNITHFFILIFTHSLAKNSLKMFGITASKFH